MHTKDLINDYFYFILEKKDTNAYTALDPELFEHYFTYWASEARGFPVYPVDQINKTREKIFEALPHIEQIFIDAGIFTDKIELVLFVGQGTSNGHAFLRKDRSIVWIPVETYLTEMQIRVFITHELVHGIHYANQPDFFFSNLFQKQNIGRQVITEGVSTFVTSSFLGCSLGSAMWADYLDQSKIKTWIDECESRIKELYAFVRENWNVNEGDATELFLANNQKDIMQNRAGYFIGYSLVNEFVRAHSLDVRSLLNVSRSELEAWCRVFVENFH